MNSLLYNAFKNGVLMFLVVSMSILNIPASSTAEVDEQTQHAPPVIEPAKSKDIILNPTPGKTKIETELPKEITETTTDGMTMLYIGGAIAGVAILAGALAANSGSSDSSSVPVEPAIPVVGPDLGGNDWLGFLDIKDKNHKGYQAISARIIHNGDAVQITTSSTLDYGKQLNGTISKGGFMLMYDSVTGEDWTTHFDNATSKRIDLYDYVNHLNDLDRMKLSR